MAVERVAVNASDPSVDGALLAWHEAGAFGILMNGGSGARVGGTHPALGGARLAVVTGGAIQISATSGPAFAATVPAAGADAVAVSAEWVAWRARAGDGDTIFAARLADGVPRRVLRAAQLGRPALEGGLLVFHVAGRDGGRIVLADLVFGGLRTIRRERRAQLLNPALADGRLAYVRAVYRAQELRVGPATRRSPRRDARVWSATPTGRRDTGHEPGRKHRRHGHPKRLWPRPAAGMADTLWTTALAADAAYVTRLRQRDDKPVVAEILRITL